MMTECQIKHMVDRFLGWKLPESFNPDCGISFKRLGIMPTGTNLLDAQQAEAMVRYMIEEMKPMSNDLPKDDILKLLRDPGADVSREEAAAEIERLRRALFGEDSISTQNSSDASGGRG